MSGITIKHRITGADIYSAPTAETVRDAVVAAVNSGANLHGADLSGAYLGGANLHGGRNILD